MKKVLLLIDDTPTVRMFAKVTLGDEYDFLEAANGQVGLEVAERQPPDLILLDYVMPVMDGIETLRALKTRPATRAIPVIMVTTKADPQMRAQCARLGCRAFLAKPIDRELLRSLVREALGG